MSIYSADVQSVSGICLSHDACSEELHGKGDLYTSVTVGLPKLVINRPISSQYEYPSRQLGSIDMDISSMCEHLIIPRPRPTEDKMTSMQSSPMARRVEIKDAYAELQDLVCIYGLTTETQIHLVLPIVRQYCTQPRCSTIPIHVWTRLRELIEFLCSMTSY
jgi:hypothetical protein